MNAPDPTHAWSPAAPAMAHRDALTGLLNRQALLRRLQQRVEQQRAAHAACRPADLAVLFLGLDRFGVINHAWGYRGGDELLQAVAVRLALAEADGDWTLARVGGDEFAILLPESHGAAAAGGVATDLLQALAGAFVVRGQAVHTSACIGVALWNPATPSAGDLLRDADIAMHEAKRDGRTAWMLFDGPMRTRLARAAQIEGALRQAVVGQQLRAVYQPIVDLDTGEMTSVEALLRWQHPELGAVSPSEFIPVAEASGHITALGEWILHTSCQQWTAWQREDAARAPATISVNLSREQMSLGRRVITVVSAALAAAQMPPQALQLEITEREVMKNPEQARELLLELSAMGVKLAMDDFGTGTSSLGCLRDFPFHTIKIDKSFVTNVCRDPHVLAVAHATVNVIENLGMVSVAEGIEDPAEVAALQAMGCRYGQGYLFARPMPGDELLATLLAGPTRSADF